MSAELANVIELRANGPFRTLWCARSISLIGSSIGLIGVLLHLADTNTRSRGGHRVDALR